MFVRSFVLRPLADRSTAIAAFGLALLMSAFGGTVAEAKIPGKTYCYKRVCHRVATIPEMVALVGRDQVFSTSFYDDCRRDRFNPCGLTSSGEAFRPGDADNAASPIYPNGTVLLLRNPSNGNSAIVRVNNSGPYWGKRKLDVSRGVAEKLGFKARGVANLEVRVVAAPTLGDTKYRKNRRYAAVPGSIGSFASLDRAQGGMMVAMALNAMPGAVFAPVAGKMLPTLKSVQPALALTLRSGNAVAQAQTGVAGQTPAEGLKAEARRIYQLDQGERRRNAPSSLTADAASWPEAGEPSAVMTPFAADRRRRGAAG